MRICEMGGCDHSTGAHSDTSVITRVFLIFFTNGTSNVKMSANLLQKSLLYCICCDFLQRKSDLCVSCECLHFLVCIFTFFLPRCNETQTRPLRGKQMPYLHVLAPKRPRGLEPRNIIFYKVS